jgi:ABC-type spermidine/putrescine transport system permease subunit II
MRAVGALVLTGTTLHVAWLVLPALAPPAIIPALVSAVALALIFASLELPLTGWRLGHA